jgi:uncharacterized membrane protein HdeD (DUF308 family)
MSSRARIALVLGLLMIALGAFIGVRLVLGSPPLTRSLPLDCVFALFFVARGALNIRAARRVEAMASARAAEDATRGGDV